MSQKHPCTYRKHLPTAHISQESRQLDRVLLTSHQDFAPFTQLFGHEDVLMLFKFQLCRLLDVSW